MQNRALLRIQKIKPVCNLKEMENQISVAAVRHGHGFHSGPVGLC